MFYNFDEDLIHRFKRFDSLYLQFHHLNYISNQFYQREMLQNANSFDNFLISMSAYYIKFQNLKKFDENREN